MTLSRFLRDYVYIPLGGNRHGRFRTNLNLMLTMLLGGLWHGASWSFLVWGALHGAFLIGHRVWVATPVAALAERARRRGAVGVARGHGVRDVPLRVPGVVLLPADALL
jgi:D-alanyl-lipoteichoic acid acyltransferase DltB (MBOAT superfamily)